MTIDDMYIFTALAGLIALVVAAPAFFRWRKTVRCPHCHTWFRLNYQGFTIQDKVVGHSSTTFGGGIGGFLGRIMAFVFGFASRRNDDPFIREWGTARFTCTKCQSLIEIDIRRDRK